MDDFLSRLAGKELGITAVIQPRPLSLFESPAADAAAPSPPDMVEAAAAQDMAVPPTLPPTIRERPFPNRPSPETIQPPRQTVPALLEIVPRQPEILRESTEDSVLQTAVLPPALPPVSPPPAAPVHPPSPPIIPPASLSVPPQPRSLEKAPEKRIEQTITAVSETIIQRIVEPAPPPIAERIVTVPDHPISSFPAPQKTIEPKVPLPIDFPALPPNEPFPAKTIMRPPTPPAPTSPEPTVTASPQPPPVTAVVAQTPSPLIAPTMTLPAVRPQAPPSESTVIEKTIVSPPDAPRPVVQPAIVPRQEGERKTAVLPPPPPTIEVKIGRIEVRATPPPAPSTPKRRAAPTVMTLEEYLHQRGKGGIS